MTFRVYNQNGKVKVTKVCRDNVERPMFSDIPDGEFAEIETEVTQCTKSRKKKIGNTQAEAQMGDGSCPFDSAIAALEYAIECGIDYDDMARLAIKVLKESKGSISEVYLEELSKENSSAGEQVFNTLFSKVRSFLEFAVCNDIVSMKEAGAAALVLKNRAGSISASM